METIVVIGVVARSSEPNEVIVGVRKKDDAGFGKLVFPGGKREQGESLGGCLVREFREEVGVTVHPGRVVDSFHDDQGFLLVVMEGTQLDDAPLRPSREIETPGYHHLDLLRRLTAEYFGLSTKRALDSYLRWREPPPDRARYLLDRHRLWATDGTYRFADGETWSQS